MIKTIAIFCFPVLLVLTASAQEIRKTKADTVTITRDTVAAKSDTTQITSYANRYDPRKALLLAAVLPGAGQVYNKKYWKLPLVYGGLGLIVNAVSFYQKAYVRYKNELFITLNGGVAPSGKDVTTLRSIVDLARRQRDYFLIIGGLVYMLQMVDAHVDAHLKEFDLNPKLRVTLKPFSEQDMMIGRSSGVALVLKF